MLLSIDAFITNTASKLRKGDHVYVEGDKDFGKGKSTVTVSLRSWQVKADSIRKLNRARKDHATDSVPADAQPEEVPF